MDEINENNDNFINNNIGLGLNQDFLNSDNNFYEPQNTKDEFNKKSNDSNLLNTEENFQEFIKGEEYVNVIIVDPKSNQYNTIQKAIDAASSYTTIKIKPGIYRESLVVSTPFLDIESENPLEQAIIISTNKPTLRVEGLKTKESIRIANLKMTNRGIFNLEQNEDFTKL